jgi:hypothetical protein
MKCNIDADLGLVGAVATIALDECGDADTLTPVGAKSNFDLRLRKVMASKASSNSK